VWLVKPSPEHDASANPSATRPIHLKTMAELITFLDVR
jgi:hypothetical protein